MGIEIRGGGLPGPERKYQAMTPHILEWLREVVEPMRATFGDVFEVGSLNVNGSPRDVLAGKARSWIGCDRVPGRGVDEVGIAADVIGDRKFDTVIACECYEHDPRFWETSTVARRALRVGGIYIVTSPSIGFPFHDYGGDFYRFTEMALRQFFFDGMIVLDVRTVGVDEHCVVGCAMRL